MKLQTIVNIKGFSQRIDYRSRIFAIGSCFADRVGEQMRRAKLSVEVNPTGVLFNPVSVCATIERLAECRYITAEELHKGEIYEPPFYHFDIHSSLSRPTADETIEAINSAIERGHSALIAADWLIITLGTAWVYRHGESGAIVANCHKRPTREFQRERLSVAEVAEQLERVIGGALQGKRIILTVSPIRHTGDGLVANSVSKSTLLLAVNEICERHHNVRYFPAYEMVIDELRDYRFYEADMVHISAVAVEYIWERFTELALTEYARELLPRVAQVVKATEHRVGNPNTEQHRQFVEWQVRAMERLPEVNFSEELQKCRDFLKINS
ncbi:MAG: GSCFA domain-containing protein [Rikenellaceae bacterium]